MTRKKLNAEAIPYPKRKDVPVPTPHRRSPARKDPNSPTGERELPTSKPRSSYKALGFGIGVFLLALLTVAQFAFLTHYNYEVNQLEQKKESLQKEKQQLEMQAIELKSHERIDRLAREELDMKKPTDTMEVRSDQ